MSLHYTSDLERNLMEVSYRGQYLLGDGKIDTTWQVSSGILTGDLDGNIYLQSIKGEQVAFAAFITEELITVINHQVTFYYDSRTNNNITYIVIAE